ncbi:MAG: phage tail protein [Anaerolineae bacterium]
MSEVKQIASTGQSRLLQYLPVIYADYPFVANLMHIFEDIWGPLERQVDHLYAYFDPLLTPKDFLPWLGRWVDVALDENWPESKQRELILQAADLYRRGGTPAGLRDYLHIYLGVEPEIIEDGTDENPYHFTVVVRVPDPQTIDVDRLQRMINDEKPAHTDYTLRLEAI